jgi:hypothetical protein
MGRVAMPILRLIARVAARRLVTVAVAHVSCSIARRAGSRIMRRAAIRAVSRVGSAGLRRVLPLQG